MKRFWLVDVLRKVHNDEEGSLSLETVLIIGAIAIPVLLVIIKFGWPVIRRYFESGLQNLQEESDKAVTQ